MKKPASRKYLISKTILATIIYFILVIMSQPLLSDVVFYNLLGFSIFLVLFVLFVISFRSVLSWFERKAQQALRSKSDKNAYNRKK